MPKICCDIDEILSKKHASSFDAILKFCETKKPSKQLAVERIVSDLYWFNDGMGCGFAVRLDYEESVDAEGPLQEFYKCREALKFLNLPEIEQILEEVDQILSKLGITPEFCAKQKAWNLSGLNDFSCELDNDDAELTGCILYDDFKRLVDESKLDARWWRNDGKIWDAALELIRENREVLLQRKKKSKNKH